MQEFKENIDRLNFPKDGNVISILNFIFKEHKVNGRSRESAK